MSEATQMGEEAPSASATRRAAGAVKAAEPVAADTASTPWRVPLWLPLPVALGSFAVLVYALDAGARTAMGGERASAALLSDPRWVWSLALAVVGLAGAIAAIVFAARMARQRSGLGGALGFLQALLFAPLVLAGGLTVLINAAGGFRRGRQLRAHGRLQLPPLGPGAGWLDGPTMTLRKPPLGQLPVSKGPLSQMPVGAMACSELACSEMPCSELANSELANSEMAFRQMAPAEARAVADQWRENGRTEHASVAAFARLSLDLLGLGAPARLLAMVQRDGLDEIRHAGLCFSLARSIDGRDVSPAAFPAAARAKPRSRIRAWALAELAINSLFEGALHEGLSARIIAALARQPVHPRIAPVLAELAEDEGRHAAHAWDVIEWCLAEGGAATRAALLGALRALPLTMATSQPAAAREGAWIRYGIHGTALESVAYEKARASVVAQAGRLLRANSEARPITQ